MCTPNRNGKAKERFNATEFAVRMLYFRHAKGRTQEQFAEQLGVALRTYQRYELGELLPKADFVYNFAQQAGVSVDYLFSGPRARSRVVDVHSLSDADKESIYPHFLPSLEELNLWREAAPSTQIKQALLNLHVRKSYGNRHLFATTFSGTYLSPSLSKLFQGAEFLPHQETRSMLEFMADYWLSALTGQYDECLMRYRFNWRSQDMLILSWTKTMLLDAEKSLLFGSICVLEPGGSLDELTARFFETPGS